ncbi:SulP family inorganic anion transporter [Sphingomonas corticis]|jgi:MFS superfamily sulfate permease-like transporter|uniref:SulP family inorganic anion transporter n=1 Tax=Sphingomonas corticis TaxID=2722791 RepID=A0ABX1CIH7_9SPHN|nr:SulP family inorganic anion transporter [Sphingomonas corticis]NJR77773.1 SulP family inorganic anion transporter [Sphingomonas corticis]
MKHEAIATPGVSVPRLQFLGRDFTASIVVFLVAMPLCMGIAIASGVPPEKGLITGIIGGIIVGALAGSPLQVSGPAAGLAVIVYELVRDHGLSALGPILVLAGAIQFAAGVFRLGGWFKAISPAVVHGMLAGIGVLIVIGQFHVLFDERPLSSGPENLAAMPARLLGLSTDIQATEIAFGVALLTIAAMLGWEKWRPASLRLMPGALVGVLAGTIAAFALGLEVARVEVPASITAAISLPGDGFLGAYANFGIVATALAIAFIASAETLLSAAAVDKMHDGVRTDYNKELRAQGVGNLLCGVAGSLPMTGVIVRSSANVQAGAITRASAIMHGVWILGFVAALPWLLREIPMAALGAILVVTGWRLVSLKHASHLYRDYGVLPVVIWATTLIMVVATDLLTGVLIGIALTVLELVPHLRRLRLRVFEASEDGAHAITLDGAATFVSLPRLAETLDRVPHGTNVRIDASRLDAVDHTSAEMLRDWFTRRRASGASVEVTGGRGKFATLAGG